MCFLGGLDSHPLCRRMPEIEWRLYLIVFFLLINHHPRHHSPSNALFYIGEFPLYFPCFYLAALTLGLEPGQSVQWSVRVVGGRAVYTLLQETQGQSNL